MVKVMLPYRGGGLPVVGGVCSLMTKSSFSVTTRGIALEYVMASDTLTDWGGIKSTLA